MTSCVVFAG
jgi:hypothetical protein